MNRPGDWQQREQALDPERSWIVQAPAGSGKTELLIQRMMVLLSGVNQPEEVLAITFTRKAAAEMSNRLVRELQDALSDPHEEGLELHKRLSRDLALNVLDRDQALGWNLMQQPGRLQIRTIDSLSAELARQLPVTSGLGGAAQITTRAQDSYQRAAVTTMSAVEDADDPLQPCIAQVLDYYDNRYDRLVELLASMLGTRDQWLIPLLQLRRRSGFDRDGLERALVLLVESTLTHLAQQTPNGLFDELPGFLDFITANEPDQGEALEALSSLAQGNRLNLRAEVAHLQHWKTLANLLLVKNGSGFRKSLSKKEGFPPPSSASGEAKVQLSDMKARFGSLLDGLRENTELLESLHAVRSLPQPEYEHDAWNTLEALLQILLRAVNEWQLQSAQRGEVDFVEMSARAIQALEAEDTPTDLALRLEHSITHILIDEFQDTSTSQVALIRQLIAAWQPDDGHSLFLVGDPMQSIYRFRKAEVSLFIRAWEGALFDEIALEPLSLSVNFRSHLPIVNWVNQVFAQALPDQSDPVMGAVHYSPSLARPNAGESGSVGLHLLPRKDFAQEARNVVELIEQAAPNEHVAILVRARTHAAAILNVLDQLKGDDDRFRYRAIDLFPLATTAMIMDLVSLTMALSQPADRLAWLAVLRAPFIGLALPDLEAITDGDSNSIIPERLERFLEGDDTGLSNDAQQRLGRVAPVLLEGLRKWGVLPSSMLVEGIWQELGGPASARHGGELEDADTFFEMLAELESRHVPIDRQRLDAELENLYAKPDSSATGNLSVMTLFAAKGLEFDHVIIPGLNRGTGNDKGKLMHWFELAGTQHIVMSPMRDLRKNSTDGDLVSFVSNAEKKRSRFETGRLMYVATTRAIQQLHLMGCIPPNSKGEFNPANGSLLNVIWPAISESVVPALEAAVGEHDEASEPRAEIPQLVRRLDADWSLPDAPEGIESESANQVWSEGEIEFSWAGEEARARGTLVHRILQYASSLDATVVDAKQLRQQCAHWCRSVLDQKGFEPRTVEKILEDCWSIVHACLESETGQWILQGHDEAHSEWALTSVFEGHARNLAIDRSFVYQGERWVIDFKTSVHAGGDLEGFMAQEADRYRGQLRTYRDAIANIDNRPIRCALYYPAFDRLLELEDL